MESGVDFGPTSRCPDSPRPHLNPATVEHLESAARGRSGRAPRAVRSEEPIRSRNGSTGSSRRTWSDSGPAPRPSRSTWWRCRAARSRCTCCRARPPRWSTCSCAATACSCRAIRSTATRRSRSRTSRSPSAGPRASPRRARSRFPGRDSGDALFSLKLATDHPHPDFRQPEKTKLRAEAFDAVGWAWVLARIDQLLGPIEGVALVPEVMIVLAAGREGGFLLRDLRLFQDGHYYLPALSLPFVGGAIARRHGADARGVLGPALRRAGRPREGAPARALRALVRDAEPAEPARAARPRASSRPGSSCSATSATATAPPTRARRATCRGGGSSPICAPRRAPRSGRSTRRASTRSPADVLERWYARHDAAYYAELARWFPEIAPPPERRAASARSGTGTRRCAATRARRRWRARSPHRATARRVTRVARAGATSVGGQELRGHAEQPVLAARLRDELHADRQPVARAARAAARSRAGRSRSRAR